MNTEYTDAAGYQVEELVVELAPATCSGCKWYGMSDELQDIDDCALDAGDASPAGRCPDCGSLCYLDRETDRARDELPRVLGDITRLVENDTTNVDADARQRLRTALERINRTRTST